MSPNDYNITVAEFFRICQEVADDMHKTRGWIYEEIQIGNESVIGMIQRKVEDLKRG